MADKKKIKRQVKKQMKRAAPRKQAPKRDAETSDAVSTDASKLLAMVRDGWMFVAHNANGNSREVTDLVEGVAGSALRQDTTKGTRPAKRRA